jgi:hypothetical protein
MNPGAASGDSRSLTLDRPFLACFVVLAVASLVPVWAIRYHPLPDLAVHLAATAVVHFHDDPHFDLAQYYTLHLGLVPYWGYYAPMHLLAYPLGLATANRAVLSLYVVGLPAGMGVLARRLGRSVALCLFGFPLVWCFNFYVGFISCCIGFALVPFALASFDAFCARSSWGRGVLAAVLGIALYFTHPLPWGLYLACAGLLGLFHAVPEGEDRLTAVAHRAVVWLVPFVVGLHFTIHGAGLNMAQTAQGFRGSYVPWRESAGELYHWIWDNCSGPEDEILAAILVVAWVALRVVARRPASGSPSSPWRERLPALLHGWRAEACAATALGAYFLLPRSILSPAYWWGINLRFAPMAALFGALCIPGAITRRRRWLLAPVVLAGLGFAVDTWIHWQVAMRFTAGFDDVAAKIEEGERVLFVIYPPWHDPSVVNINYALIYPDVLQAQRGGYMPWNFDEGFPLRYAKRFPAPSWREHDFRWEAHARYYDDVVTFQQGDRNPFGSHSQNVKEVVASGKWILWRLPAPRDDTPPLPPYPSGWATDPAYVPPPRP